MYASAASLETAYGEAGSGQSASTFAFSGPFPYTEEEDANTILRTPLSRAKYMETLKSRKLDDKAIEEIRARGKKEGVPEKDIELAIEMAKAFDSMDSEPPENAVLLSAKKSDFDRIFRIEILGKNGEPVNMPSRSTSSRGDASLMTLQPSEAVPADATLELFVLTDKSRVSFPFELNVPLP